MLTALLFVVAAGFGSPTPPTPPSPLPVSFRNSDTELRVMVGDEHFTSLRTKGLSKPALYPLLAPGARHVTRGYPIEPRTDEEHDHPHHTSLWFAHGDVNSHDFWTCSNGARIVPVGTPSTEVREHDGIITSTYAWQDAGSKTICTEHRTMRFAADAHSRTIDFDFTITASDGPVTLGDTKEGTFGVRLAPTLRLKGSVAKGSILSSTGERDAACWGKRAAWVRYAGPVEGIQTGVTIFDHPRNPRHSTWWHARDYGLFAANPFGVHDFEGKPKDTGKLDLAAGESIRFRYRLVIDDAARTPEELNAALEAYARQTP